MASFTFLFLWYYSVSCQQRLSLPRACSPQFVLSIERLRLRLILLYICINSQQRSTAKLPLCPFVNIYLFNWREFNTIYRVLNIGRVVWVEVDVQLVIRVVMLVIAVEIWINILCCCNWYDIINIRSSTSSFFYNYISIKNGVVVIPLVEAVIFLYYSYGVIDSSSWLLSR